MRLLVSGQHRFRILVTHTEAFFRAHLNTITARDASESRDGPRLFFFTDDYCAGRAFSLANAAEYAFRYVYYYTTPGCIGQYLWPKRIFDSERLSKKAFQDCLCHDKKSHSYLSAQLMHGSMVRTSTGTSARLEPGSIFTRLGILANVGVLTLRRCKNLVPFALA